LQKKKNNKKTKTKQTNKQTKQQQHKAQRKKRSKTTFCPPISLELERADPSPLPTFLRARKGPVSVLVQSPVSIPQSATAHNYFDYRTSANTELSTINLLCRCPYGSSCKWGGQNV